MKNMIQLLKKYKELIMYLIFGVLTTLVNIVTYYISTKIFHIDYQISNVIGWILSVTFAFITNKIFVFESKDRTLNKVLKEGLSFYSFRLISLGLDMAIMYVMVSLLNINDLISKVVSNIIVVIINYIFSKLFIFKKDK